MDFRKPKSVFHCISSRELNSFPVRKRPATVFNEIGAIDARYISDADLWYVPCALSFSKSIKHSYDLAVADDDGYVHLFNTRSRSMIDEWRPHEDTILDVCWLKEDTRIVTASCDETVKVWDVEQKACLRELTEHEDTVETICSHPTSDDIIVSGSSDGSFCLWDLRCNSITVKGNAHRHVKYGQVEAMKITSVLWLKDQVSIATGGSKDSVPKIWDIRYLNLDVSPIGPLPQPAGQQRLEGITSLSQDDRGVLLSASCKDSRYPSNPIFYFCESSHGLERTHTQQNFKLLLPCRIYLYNTLQLERGPLRSYEAGSLRSYVKAAISPDALNIASGSEEGNIYISKVNNPQEQPTILFPSEDENVSLVDWSFSEFGKLATAGENIVSKM
ncbi:protein ANTHESIS POMOTING FACTOR [Trifolium repens]|nr:protein ANTHESIS POMOTING FACTOR [Trifolium repens]